MAKLKSTKAPPKGKKASIERRPYDKIELLGFLKQCFDPLKEAISEAEKELKSEILDEASKALSDGQSMPENFVGLSEPMETKIVHARRAKNSPLTESEVEFLEKHGLPVETIYTETEYTINPKMLKDPDLVKAIDSALSDNPTFTAQLDEKGYSISDVLIETPSNEKKIVGDSTISALSGLGASTPYRKILDTVIEMKLTHTLTEDYDIDKAVELVRKVLT